VQHDIKFDGTAHLNDGTAISGTIYPPLARGGLVFVEIEISPSEPALSIPVTSIQYFEPLSANEVLIPGVRRVSHLERLMPASMVPVVEAALDGLLGSLEKYAELAEIALEMGRKEQQRGQEPKKRKGSASGSSSTSGPSSGSRSTSGPSSSGSTSGSSSSSSGSAEAILPRAAGWGGVR
jgi:hypothetical protein